MIGTNEKENMEITTDTHGIYMRNYEDTLVTRDIPVKYGYYNDNNEYIENGTLEITHYQYAHNPMELYELNQNQPELRLEGYEAPYFEAACYKGIPMNDNWFACGAMSLLGIAMFILALYSQALYAEQD